MNDKYLLKLKEDMILKNFAASTCEDYYRFVKRFLTSSAKRPCPSLMLIYASLYSI